MTDLELIAAGAELSAIDLRFADLIRRLASSGPAPESAQLLELTAALVSRERGRGHPCIELDQWAERPLAGESAGKDAARFPERARWLRVLRASALVGSGAELTPLVVDAAARCYLYRYWKAEQRLADRIRRCVTERPEDVDLAAVAPVFRALFAAGGAAEVDWQALAAAAVLRSRLAVVSGGPGTGKTSTVARIAALLAAHDPQMHIELAAPTGKAAARLSESMRVQAAELPLEDQAREAVAALEARTIHRLLGYAPGGARFRHDAERPLACDVLIVDEASMIDLLLMDALLAALPSHARIVLVGDKDQLASVEAGFVFGDLCEAASGAGAYSTAFALDYRALSGRDLRAASAPTPANPANPASAASAGGALRDIAVELKIGWRFRDKPAIEKLAAAVKACDAEAALAALGSGASGGAERLDLPADAASVVNAIYDVVSAVVTARAPEQALERLGQVRVLCATNRGPWSVAALNLLVERALDDDGHATSARWYRGRPVLITSNDYAMGLFNGDVGVCFPDEDGRMRVWFAAAGGVRAVAPAKLPEHETAWAMTVHKSQGSEFDRVVFVVPERDSPLLTRELVYTAVTRAREQVTIFAAPEVLRAAITRRAERVSGLRDLLSAV